MSAVFSTKLRMLPHKWVELFPVCWCTGFVKWVSYRIFLPIWMPYFCNPLQSIHKIFTSISSEYFTRDCSRLLSRTSFLPNLIVTNLFMSGYPELNLSFNADFGTENLLDARPRPISFFQHGCYSSPHIFLCPLFFLFRWHLQH